MHAYDAKHTARTCEEQAFTRYYPLKEEIPARSYFVKEFPLLRDNSISDKNLATPDWNWTTLHFHFPHDAHLSWWSFWQIELGYKLFYEVPRGFGGNVYAPQRCRGWLFAIRGLLLKREGPVIGRKIWGKHITDESWRSSNFELVLQFQFHQIKLTEPNLFQNDL